MKKLLYYIAILTIIVVGFHYLSPYLPKAGAPQAAAFADPKNGTYTIENEKVTLASGKAEQSVTPDSSSKEITEYFGNVATGDVNGDGLPDKVFLLVQAGGGSGTFYYIAVALGAKSGGYTGTNAVFIGDRIAPQSTEINKGNIIVNYADRLPGEPFTAEPTIGMSKYFRVTNGVLAEIKNPNSD